MNISKTVSHPAGVSFLVCTFNGAERIAETLACLARQDIPPGGAWEIILVDNASTDGTSEMVRQIWKDLGTPAPLVLLHEPRPGKQHALELAISKVNYQFTCIVDDDNRLAPDYLRVGVEILQSQSQVAILGGANIGSFEGQEPAWFAAFQHCYAVGPQLDRVGGGFIPLTDGNIGRNVLWGAGMFVRTILWLELRELGFQSLFSGRQGEANLTAGEDDELCYVALLLGYEVWYSSRLQLQHHMAMGRLTEGYRDRLFAAAGCSATRLNAYRNALWGKPGAAVGTNLLKDISYNVLGILKNVCSLAFVRESISGNSIVIMNQWNALMQVKDALLHFRRVKNYYGQVLQFKRQLSFTFKSSQPDN